MLYIMPFPNNFCGAMKAVIDWRGITYKELGERIMVDDQTSSRIVNGKREKTVKS